MFNPSREQVRRFFCDAWKKHQEHLPLVGAGGRTRLPLNPALNTLRGLRAAAAPEQKLDRGFPIPADSRESSVTRLQPAGARVADGISAAGGVLDTANTNQINLAARLADGDKIWVPEVGQTVINIPDTTVRSTGFLININAASASEIETLPGIGEVKAGQIVSYRDEHGPFAVVEDLLEVRERLDAGDHFDVQPGGGRDDGPELPGAIGAPPAAEVRLARVALDIRAD